MMEPERFEMRELEHKGRTYEPETVDGVMRSDGRIVLVVVFGPPGGKEK